MCIRWRIVISENNIIDKAMKTMKQLLLAVMVMMTASVQAQQTEEGDLDAKYATELVKVGSVAPDFTMQTIDGKPFSLSELKGRVVVLDFWASWCPDCRKEAPAVVELYKKYSDKGVAFVGVSMDTNVEAWRAACEKYGITYPQVSELKKFHDTDISKAYGVKWIPSIVVIDQDGKVALATVVTERLASYLEALR